MELKPHLDEIDVRRLAVRELWSKGIRARDAVVKALAVDYKIVAKPGQVTGDLKECAEDDRKMAAWKNQEGDPSSMRDETGGQ